MRTPSDSEKLRSLCREQKNNLAEHSFSGWELAGFNFSDCNLTGADFTDAKLDGANFNGAILARTKFCHAELSRSSFFGSTGEDVDLSKCTAIAADFSLCEFKRARFYEAKLDRANFTQSELIDSDFSLAELTMTIFSATKLSGVTLTSASLTETIFVAVDLAGISLDEAAIETVYADTRTLQALKDAESSGLDVAATARALQDGGVKLSLEGPIPSEFNKPSPGMLKIMPEYVVTRGSSTKTLQDYLEVLEKAQDETTLQSFLEQNPWLLIRPLPAHHQGWVLPRPRLKGDFIPDFLVCGLSSVGLSWLAVEIESPTASLFTAKGRPSAKLTEAMAQIRDWRSWLSANLGVARNPKSQHGLNLVDIYPNLPGLILIGRDSDGLSKFSEQRKELGRESNIEIRTYDYLARPSFSVERFIRSKMSNG